MTDTLARMRQLVGTPTQWAANDLVIADGEIAVEVQPDATVLTKIGTGGRKYSQLPYAANSALYALGNGAALIGFIQAAVAAITRDVLAKLREVAVTPADFSTTVGTGADDTLVMQRTFAAAVAYRTVRLERGRTYLMLSGALPMAQNSHLDINGATIEFRTPGSVKNIVLASGCTIEGGWGLLTNTAAQGGVAGDYQTLITAGESFSLGSTAVIGFAIRNVQIRSNRPDGGIGIGIMGASRNGLIENIGFGDSATMQVGILTHWSKDQALPTVPAYTGTTEHPRNLTIRNLSAGVWSYGTDNDLDQSLVFLSASYNITIENVYATNIQHGKGVTVYAGDYGFQFGTVIEQTLGYAGITIRNVTGQYLKMGHVYGVDSPTSGQPVHKNWPGNVVWENCNAIGLGSTSNESKGLRVEGANSCVARRCIFDGFYTGVWHGGLTGNFKMEGGEIRNSWSHGYDGGLFATGTSNQIIEGVLFTNNNAANAANTCDITLANDDGVTVEKCRFNSPNAANSLRANNTVGNLRIVNNRTIAVSAAGPVYSIGISTDTNICTLFAGNTSDATPTNGFAAGQAFLPFLRMNRSAGAFPYREYLQTAPPTAAQGTFFAGDVVHNSAPTTGTPPRWRCVAGGAPGTWKAEASLL